MSDILQISMLGRFSLCLGDKFLDDHSNRMRKVWLLLAYLIYFRESRITQDRFVSLLSGTGQEDWADPANRMKAMFYRARTMLNQLGENLGHDLVLYKNGTYAWNTEIPLKLDIDEFETLCKGAEAADDKTVKLERYLRACDLYKGDFLPKLSMEPWVMPISTYYHQMYLDAVQQGLSLLEEKENWEDAGSLCEAALKTDPYSEDLYQHLIRCRMARGDRSGAALAYEELCEILFSTFGVMPSEESRLLYRRTLEETEGDAVAAATIREQLKESDGAKGAMFCEYDFFKMHYQLQARSIARSGDIIHIVLLSIRAKSKKALSRRSLDLAMDHLKELLLGSLRKGDVVTRCSVSQFVVMLPQANYENSCMVCDRILRAFYRKYPHSPADIHFSVQPLEPLTS